MAKRGAESLFSAAGRLMACLLQRPTPASPEEKVGLNQKGSNADESAIHALCTKAREEIDQLNRDRSAAKSRILCMRRNGVDKIKIMPHLQSLKRLEARIQQKNKILLNIEASADTAADAELVIQSAKIQKEMIGIQKKSLSKALDGADIEDVIDDITEHHEDIQDITQTLSEMQLGGLSGMSDEITEEDFDQWFQDNEPAAANVTGQEHGVAPERVAVTYDVEELPVAPDHVPVPITSGNVRTRKPKLAPMTL